MKVNNTEDFENASKWKLETRILKNVLVVYCLLNLMTQIDKDCDTYNEYICIYGPEIGSYCFSSNCDVGLLENVAENIR